MHRPPSFGIRAPSGCHRAVVVATLLALSLGFVACGSSTTSTTSPSTVSRCAITLQGVESQIPAQGGSGTVGVVAARDCSWSAVVEGQWLSISAGRSGQGDGTVEFAAAANPDPSMRRGALVLNNQRAELTQAGAPCSITLVTSSASFGQGGGSGLIQVQASSGQCTWTASSDVDWINLRSSSGSGNGQVAFDVVATAGSPRSGTVTIAGQRFSVTQAEGCSYAITPTASDVAASGGSGTVAIAAPPACPWTASSNVDWLSLSQPAGTGPAVVAFSAAATSGAARTGTAIIAGLTFTVTQSPSQGCTYNVQPNALATGAAGGGLSVQVGTDRACSWAASSDVPWITVQGPAARSGDGSLTLTVAATNGPTRTGTVTVAGQTVTITQSPGCAFAISPETASAAAAGGTGSVNVSAAAGCAWAATSNASWLTITSGASGSGTGEVRYSAAATSGPARTATLTIAGRTFTVNQGQGCDYTLSAPSATIDDSGGQGAFTVQSAAGCTWTAQSSAAWITITAPNGGTGSGTGEVRFTAAANAGPSRSGAITAGGRTFSIQQGNGCSYALSSPSETVASGGGSDSVNVIAGSGCSWTSTSNASWLTITSGASGTGNGTVGFTAAAHTGPARSGTLTIAGRTFTVNQGGACSFAIAPTSASVAAGGGTTSVAVTTASGCAWTAASQAPWITVTAGASGSGNGSVELTVAAHSGGARSGTVTIAGRTFTVNQGTGCSYAIAPTAQSVPETANQVAVNVTAGASCTWTSTSNAPWLTVAGGGSGTGNGTVQVDVQANPGPGRSGTVTIAGQTLTVTQGSGCSYTVLPDNIVAPAAGSAPRVDVTTAASCAWTAVSGAPWLTVTSGAAGSGTGFVDLAVAANSGPARSGSATVAGRTVNVAQDSGCSYSLSAMSQSMVVGGGAGSVNVMAGPGCTWTAVSNVPWIVLTAGSSGAGDGAVQFTVNPNATGAPRSGTLTIAGLTYTVNQD